jgi:response regulator RpfG family c-di-GMP phosphodiesterase
VSDGVQIAYAFLLFHQDFQLSCATVINILLVDSDLGFTFWLGQLLDQAGYEAFPAKSIADAIQLLDQLKFQIDLLLLNPTLEGAASLASVLRHSQPHIRIVAVHDPDVYLDGFEMDASHPKTHGVDDAARGEWLNFIRMFCRPAVAMRRS